MDEGSAIARGREAIDAWRQSGTSNGSGGASSDPLHVERHLLTPREREVMTLRFIEEWEYHEIAAAHAIPIGTVQWRVFNAKKKLAPYLTTRPSMTRKAA